MGWWPEERVLSDDDDVDDILKKNIIYVHRNNHNKKLKLKVRLTVTVFIFSEREDLCWIFLTAIICVKIGQYTNAV